MKNGGEGLHHFAGGREVSLGGEFIWYVPEEVKRGYDKLI